MKQIQHTIWLVALFFSATLWANPSADEPKYTALLIAIDEYSSETWQNTTSNVKDANVLRTTLEEKYGFSDVQTLYNAAATRVNIIDKLEKFSKNAKENDNLLIFFSGHGIEKEKEGFWVPADAKADERYELVSNSEVKNVLSKANSQHILLLADACFSGSSFKSPSFFVENDGTDSYYEKISNLISRQAVVSGSIAPVADGANVTSVFMKYVLKFLQKNEKPRLDAGELYEFLKYPVFANSPNMPRFGHIQDTGHEGGQFVFRLATNPPTSDKVDKPQPKEECLLSATIENGRNVVFKDTESALKVTASAKDATYQWFFNDKLTTEKSAVKQADKEGIYKVIVATSNTCKKELSAFVKIELPPADVYIEQGSNAEFTMKGELRAITDATDVSVQWRKNGVLVSKSFDLKVYQSGTYTVSLYRKGEKVAEAKTNVIVNPRIYRTKLGDDVESIARKFYGEEGKAFLIYDANQAIIKKGDALKIGTALNIPLAEASIDEIEDNDVVASLKIAGANGLAPFCTEGLYNDGMITELVKQSFDLIGQPVEMDFMGLSEVRGATFNGKYAAAFPFPKNKRDERTMIFSDPIYEVYNVFFAKKDADINFSSPKKLRGKTVGVVVGYNIDEIEEFYNKKYVKLKPCRSLEDAFDLLQKGEIDLVATSQIGGFGLIKRNPKFSEADFKVLPNAIGSNTLHLAVSNKHPMGNDIIKAFNDAFKQLKSSGKAFDIIDTHLDKFQNIKP